MTLATAAGYAVSAWPLNEASGTRADQVGSNDLADNNTVGVGTGQFGNAADFESGNAEYLSIADNPSLSLGDTDWQISLWLKPESDSTWNWAVNKDSAGDGEIEISSQGGTWIFKVYSSGGFGGAASVSSGTFTTGSWALLVAQHSATSNKIRLSVNGSAFAETSHSAGVANTTAPFELGALSAYSRYYDGLMEDVVILQGYLMDDTEVDELWNAGAGVAFADWAGGGGFKAYWSRQIAIGQGLFLMYPKNAASPEPIAIGAVVQISDGAVQTSGCTVRIKPIGVAEGDGAGTTSYSTDGIVYYTPTQAETNYTSFILIAKKASCIPVSVTVITTSSATPGTVLLAPVTHTSAVIPTVTTTTIATNLTNAPTNGDFTNTMKTSIGTAVAASAVASVTGNVTGSVGSVAGSVGSVTGNVGGNVVGSVGSVAGNVGGNVVGTIGALASQAKADVNAEVDQAITDAALATATSVATLTAYVDTEVAAIKAKTDNLPSDPADASDIAAAFASVASSLATLAAYVDTEVAAIKAKTDQLTFTNTNKLDSALLAVGDLAAAVANKIADHVRRRTQANVEASADGDAVSLGSEYGMIQSVQKQTVVGNTGTIYKTDGTTILGTKTYASDAAAERVTGVS